MTRRMESTVIGIQPANSVAYVDISLDNGEIELILVFSVAVAA